MSEKSIVDYIDGLACIICVRNRVAEYTFDLATIHVELDGGGFSVEEGDEIPPFFNKMIARAMFAIVAENKLDTSRGVPPPIVMAAYRQAENEFKKVQRVVDEIAKATTLCEASAAAAEIGAVVVVAKGHEAEAGGIVVKATYVLESLDGQELDRCNARSDGEAWAKFEQRLIETQGVGKGHFSPAQFRIKLASAVGAAGPIAHKMTEAERARMN